MLNSTRRLQRRRAQVTRANALAGLLEFLGQAVASDTVAVACRGDSKMREKLCVAWRSDSPILRATDGRSLRSPNQLCPSTRFHPRVVRTRHPYHLAEAAANDVNREPRV